MVGRDGLEPSTSRLSGVRSNHLSYRPASRSEARLRTRPPGARGAAPWAKRPEVSTTDRVVVPAPALDVKGYEGGPAA